jgi:hypothetical protein
VSSAWRLSCLGCGVVRVVPVRASWDCGTEKCRGPIRVTGCAALDAQKDGK